MWVRRGSCCVLRGIRRFAHSAPIDMSVPHVELAVMKRKTPVTVRNIYCIGRNYVAHAEELGNAVPQEEPVIFLKSSASLRGLNDRSPTAFPDETFHHELEMVLLIGQDIPLGELQAGKEKECIRAVGLGLDMTRRGVQSQLKAQGYPWTTAKSFAGSAIVSPMTQIDSEVDLDDVSFELEVRPSDETSFTKRQAGHVSLMVFNVAAQLRFLNSLGPLLRGDLVFTGTPAGVSNLNKGDAFRMRFTSGFTRHQVWHKGTL